MSSQINRRTKAAISLSGARGEILGVSGLITGWAVTANLWLGGVLLGLSLAVYAVATYGTRRKASIHHGEMEAATEDFVRAADLSEFMRALAQDTQLIAPWRISIYEEREGSWARICRASNHAAFRNSGRKIIPYDQGVLEAASRTQVVEPFVGLPDPATEWDSYVAFHESRRVPQAVVEAFTMRSRSYACVVKPVRTLTGTHIDVGVVLESEDPQGVQAGLVDRHVGSHVVDLMHRLVTLAPRLERARQSLDSQLREQNEVV